MLLQMRQRGCDAAEPYWLEADFWRGIRHAWPIDWKLGRSRQVSLLGTRR